MSFRCEKCNAVAVRSTKVVIERKMVDHLGTSIRRGPRGGSGSQIVRETAVCEACLSVVPEAPLERAELQETLRATIEEVA